MRKMVLHARRAAGPIVLASACLLSLAACSQSPSATQIPAGTTAALGSPGSSAAPDAPQGAMLQNALTSDTRQTLQQAMDSTGSGK